MYTRSGSRIVHRLNFKMNTKKRGQITLFIILAVVLLAGVLIYYYAAGRSTGQESEMAVEQIIGTELDDPTVRAYVGVCMYNISRDAIWEVSLTGGYYPDMPNILDTRYGRMPYYYDYALADPLGNMITDAKLIESLTKYFENNFDTCINDFQSLEEQGYSIRAGDYEVSWDLKEDIITTIIDYPLRIEKQEGKTLDLSIFQVNVNTRLKNIRSLAEDFIISTIIDPYSIDITEVFDLMAENNYQIDISREGDESLAYFIQDLSNYNQYGMPLVYRFGVKVNTTNHAPEILTQSLPEAYVGIPYTYTIEYMDPEHEWMFIIEDSNLWDYSEFNMYTGEIDFIPDMNQTGIHQIEFTVYDERNASSSKVMELKISQ